MKNKHEKDELMMYDTVSLIILVILFPFVILLFSIFICGIFIIVFIDDSIGWVKNKVNDIFL